MTLLQRLQSLPQRTPYLFPTEGVPAHFRKAAVMILLWEEAGTPHTLLTLRASHLSSFANQMCFPGGRLDPGETFEQAALRETHEEIGIAPEHINVVGRLDDAWSGGGYLMVPYVGLVQGPPATTANDEVAEILTLAITEDMQVDKVDKTVDDITYKEHQVMCQHQTVIGLTADLLLEAVEMLDGINSLRGPTRYRYLLEYESRQSRS
jgi:mutator protein MutT